MDKQKAVVLALVQGSEISRGQGRGYTLSGLERVYASLNTEQLAVLESAAKSFETEFGPSGYEIVAKSPAPRTEDRTDGR